MNTKKDAKKVKQELIKSETEPKKNVKMRMDFGPSEDANIGAAKAVFTVRPSANAAIVINKFSGKYVGRSDNASMETIMVEQMKAVNNGDLTQCEAILYGQAQTLQSIFTTMALRASSQEYLHHIEGFLKLAFRAQSQCAKTLEILANIKSPSVIFAKQANFSHGHQQVNNGNSETNTSIHAPAQEKTIQSSELLENQNGERMDS